MAFGLTCHLPFGNTSSLEAGRPGDGAWWVTEGCYLGCGPCLALGGAWALANISATLRPPGSARKPGGRD